jgi:hypothetical protein
VGKIGKAVAAFLYAVALVAVAKWTGDQHIDAVEWAVIATAVTTNAGVFLIPVFPQAGWTKTAVGVLTAGLAVVEVALLDNLIDANEALMIAAALLGAAGITVTPAKSNTGAAVGWGSDRPVAATRAGHDPRF